MLNNPIVRTQVRIPADLMEEIKEWARLDGRSMNAQIVQVLREANSRRKVNK